MMIIQHGCEGLLRFIVPDDTVKIDMEIMTLKGIHIFKQDKNSSEKAFIPWRKDNKPPSSFLKRVRETQKKTSKEFLETVLDQKIQPNFRPKHSGTCPNIATMSDNQFVQDAKLKITKETDKNNILVMEKTKETQDHDQSRPPKPDKKIPSDLSDSEDGKDDQGRAKPLDTQDPQPTTCYASHTNDATPLS